MRLLLIDDDAEQLKVFNELLPDRTPGIEIFQASNLADARALIEARRFDVAVVDLRLPTTADATDEADEHGIAIIEKIRAELPGTPTIILTGYGSMELVQRTYKRYMQDGMPFGGKSFRLFEVITKENLRDCFTALAEMQVDWQALSDIELEFGARVPRLAEDDKRILKAATRSFGCVKAEVGVLAGGLSEATTYRFVASDDNGRIRTIAAAKIASPDAVRREKRAFESYVAGMLRPGSFATLLSEIQPAGTIMSGLFYRLADAGTSGQMISFFDLIARTEHERVHAPVEQLAILCEPWTRNRSVTRRAVGDIRRELIDDESFRNVDRGLFEETREVERRTVTVALCSQHRDLHGENILVQPDMTLMLIDFAHVREAPAGLDSIILEMSLLTHQRGRAIAGEWPTVGMASSWCDVDAYTGEGTPELVRHFVRACRAWGQQVAGGFNALAACGYAYAIRQLRFPDVDADVMRAIARGSANRLLESG